jgi:hypothetical protein
MASFSASICVCGLFMVEEKLRQNADAPWLSSRRFASIPRELRKKQAHATGVGSIVFIARSLSISPFRELVKGRVSRRPLRHGCYRTPATEAPCPRGRSDAAPPTCNFVGRDKRNAAPLCTRGVFERGTHQIAKSLYSGFATSVGGKSMPAPTVAFVLCSMRMKEPVKRLAA